MGLVLEEFQNDKSIGAVVLTGSEKAFAGWVTTCKSNFSFSSCPSFN